MLLNEEEKERLSRVREKLMTPEDKQFIKEMWYKYLDNGFIIDWKCNNCIKTVLRDLRLVAFHPTTLN